MLLSRYLVVQTNRPDELVDGLLQRQPWMRDVSVTATPGWLYQHFRVQLGSIELSTSSSTGVSYRSDTSGSITVGLALSGHQLMTVGNETRMMPEMASFLPTVPVMGMVRDCRFALVRLNRARLVALLDEMDVRPAEIRLGAYLARHWLQPRPDTAALDSTLRFLFRHLDRFGEPQPGEARALEDLVYAQAASALVGPVHPRRQAENSAGFSRAMAFILENLAADISVMDVAKACGLSLRGTQAMFQRHGHTSITGAIRNVRLSKARELLQAGRPGDTVLGVSLEVGFNHISYFTRAYRATFGETPGDSLRRAR